MQAKRTIFLSKNGKTFGPFSEGEIEEFRNNGELSKFTWIFHDLKQGWIPIGPPPPLPPILEEAVQLSEEKAPAKKAPVQKAPVQETPLNEDLTPTPAVALSISRALRESEHKVEKAISALCHHHKTILSGLIKDINSEGCTLTDAMPSSKTMPLLKEGNVVHLSLLDAQESLAENISAKVSGAIKNKGYWDYRIKWDSIPKILKISP